MEYPIFENVEMVSERIQLLRYMVGKRIKDIFKIFSKEKKFPDLNSMLQSVSLGAVFVLDDNSQIGFVDDESTGSLGAFSIKSPDGLYNASSNYEHLTIVSTSSLEGCENGSDSFIGKTIRGISIIQGNYSSLTLNKVGVVLNLDFSVPLVVFMGGKLYLEPDLPKELKNEIHSINSLENL